MPVALPFPETGPIQLQLRPIENGAQLGFLLDPLERRVYLYRPGAPVVCLEKPTAVSGDPELPGFTLDLTRIWEKDF